MTREEFEGKMDAYVNRLIGNDKAGTYDSVAIYLRQLNIRDFIWDRMEQHAQGKEDTMCDKEKAATEFESRLIWNDDRTECFLPEEFSNAKIWDLFPLGAIDVFLKNESRVRYSPSQEIDTAKQRLRELMKEIAEKTAIPDYRMVRKE